MPRYFSQLEELARFINQLEKDYVTSANQKATCVATANYNVAARAYCIWRHSPVESRRGRMCYCCA